MNLTFRTEEPYDYRAVEALTREAFWNLHVPGCDEHFALHTLREHADFLPGLSFIAETDGALAGHIAYSRSAVIAKDGREHPAITFGPVSVYPAYQRQGVGSALIRRTLDLAREAGHAAVIIYGDPDYYGRFGFSGGKAFGIRNKDGRFQAALLALELAPRALEGVSGLFHESKGFDYPEEEFAAFDALFSPKEKRVTPTQAEFTRIASRFED